MGEEINPKLIAKYIMQYQAQEDNLIKYQLETEKDLDNFKHELLGESYNPDKQKWEPDPGKMQTCNSQGANAIVSQMKLHVNRIVSLSNFKNEDDINTYSFYDIKAWIFYLVEHKEDFGFKSYADISMVLSTIDKLNVATMKKAVLGWEGERLTHQFSHVESSEKVIQQTDKPKMFGGLLMGR